MKNKDMWNKMKDIIPQKYIVKKINENLDLNQRNLMIWDKLQATRIFCDIEESNHTDDKNKNKIITPKYDTYSKICYNNDYLYVYARLYDEYIIADITKKNEVIFYNNDFEIFIDPDKDNINYYEFEMNALNTIWELSLPVAYKDKGNPINPDNLQSLKSNVFIKGELNNPFIKNEYWDVQIAIPFNELNEKFNKNYKGCPKHSNQMKLNFSRVQWDYNIIDDKFVKIKKPEYNWVWSGQGIIDMHRPEKWGYIQFNEYDDIFKEDKYYEIKNLAMGLYYTQKDNFEDKNLFLEKDDLLETYQNYFKHNIKDYDIKLIINKNEYELKIKKENKQVLIKQNAEFIILN